MNLMLGDNPAVDKNHIHGAVETLLHVVTRLSGINLKQYIDHLAQHRICLVNEGVHGKRP